MKEMFSVEEEGETEQTGDLDVIAFVILSSIINEYLAMCTLEEAP